MKGSLIKKVQFDCHFTDFIHPSTYVNKLLFSGSQGKEDEQKPCMQLWNIMNHEKLFDFNDIVSKESELKDIEITCLEQSPVIDVVAVGFSNGDILLVNILYNEELLRFKDAGSIASLAFSSDTTLGFSLLASVSQSSSSG